MTEESQAVFSVMLNVRGGSQNYKNCIENLRKQVAKTFICNISVLPDQKLTNQMFHVVLVNNDNEITLCIRLENLYLVGYKTNDSTSWLEFGKNTTSPSPHQILGSTFLGFSCNYNDLERVANVESRNEIRLGEPNLIGAAYVLQKSIECKTFPRGNTAHALIIMIRMICESMRFIKISDHIVKYFSSGFTPESWMSNLEARWGRISRDFLKLDDEQINTGHESINILGVVLHS